MEKKKRHRKKYRNVIDLLAEPFVGSGTPACPYFNRCGGCLFQDIAYDNQLIVKGEYIKKLFSENPSMSPLLETLEVKGSTSYGYRNRMDFVCAFGKRGLRERGNFREAVDIDHCMLMNPRMNSVWKEIRAATKGTEDYNYLSHEGFLRYSVIRSGFYSGEIMVSFVIARKDSAIDPVVEKIAPLVDSLSIITHEGLADLSFGTVTDIPKRGFIEEKFEGISYRITPNSFFQSNSECALQMYRRIADEVSGEVLDLFSGVGSITLFAAKNAQKITGVEIIEEAVLSARENALKNNIANADFICADALPFMKENKNRFDTLILDPPRTGVHPKAIKAIRECAPQKIVYMSCNPATFRDNLIQLEEYTPTVFEAYDMFPQTPHLETLAVLTRKP